MPFGWLMGKKQHSAGQPVLCTRCRKPKYFLTPVFELMNPRLNHWMCDDCLKTLVSPIEEKRLAAVKEADRLDYLALGFPKPDAKP